MILSRNLIFFLFTLLTIGSFAQTDEHKKNLLGTWIAQESKDGVLFKKADELESEKYGMSFNDDGTLTRRSNRGLFEIEWFNHPGQWHFSGDTLILYYEFDAKQHAREKVFITQLAQKYFRFARIDWVEIRK